MKWDGYLAAGALLLMSGCHFEERITSRGATGVVIDAKSLRPLSGAVVGVAQYSEQPIVLSNAVSRIRKPTAVTGDDGRFSIPAQKETIKIFILGDYFTPPDTLLIRCTGYNTAAIPLPDRTPVDTTTRLHQYFLEPDSQGSRSR